MQYFGATLCVAIIQICINPLMAKNLSPEDYAIIGYYSSFTLLFTPLITFFVSNFYIQRFFNVNEETRTLIKATSIKLLIYCSFLLSVITLGILFLYHVFINQDSDIPFSPYAALMIFAIPLTGIYSLELADCRLRRNAKRFAYYTLSYGVLSALLAIFLVAVIKGGAFGRLVATILANLIFFFTVLYSQKQYLRYKIDKTIVNECITFCWPLTLAGMLGFFTAGFDKVLLERLGNVQELGYYCVGAQIAGYISVFSNAVNSTFQPDVYESYSKRDFKRLFLYVGIIVGSITICAILYVIFAPFIIDVLTYGRYVYAAKYSQIIALSAITSAMYYSSSQITIAMGRTKMLLIIKILGALCSTLCYIWLVHSFNFNGAAWGNVISYILFFAINILSLTVIKNKLKI